jgi:hypothetical protein
VSAVLWLDGTFIPHPLATGCLHWGAHLMWPLDGKDVTEDKPCFANVAGTVCVYCVSAHLAACDQRAQISAIAPIRIRNRRLPSDHERARKVRRGLCLRYAVVDKPQNALHFACGT